MSGTRPYRGSQLELDDKRAEAFWNGQRLELSPESFHVLKVFARAPENFVPPHELSDAVIEAAGGDIGVLKEFGLSKSIELIRTAFEKIDPHHQYIEILPRRGYKWSEP